MFQQLAARLQEAIDRLRGRGRITEEDLKGTLREVRRALIEADVNLEVARAFVEEVRERALGRKVLESLTPAEVVLATVYEALKEALGGEPKHPQLKDRNVWFLVGLQGSGKTTTAAKLALYYKGKGRRPLLVAADTQRPAAREQLRVLGEKVGVPVLGSRTGKAPSPSGGGWRSGPAWRCGTSSWWTPPAASRLTSASWRSSCASRRRCAPTRSSSSWTP